MKTKATLPSLFILPITYDQFSTGFTSFISSDRISQFNLHLHPLLYQIECLCL
nr:MAG TPA: hypothetical protein [Caudoviricetes sp.]